MIRYFSILLAAMMLVMSGHAFSDEADQTEEPPKLPYAPTADEVLKQIALRGARPVVWELFDRDAEWDRLLREISSGDPRWLKVAARLRKASDAGASEELGDAINDAVEKSPELVLEMGYCGETLYDSTAITFDELMAGVNRKIEALSKVKRCDLIKKRDRCIKSLREWILEARKDFRVKDKK